ncbi:hypothetical protein [Trueperella pyogenes]|uniref:hypothetical protein n=1 Tax=Trueperella pyogenes TaxID=1661 RepID=UPI0006617239|nr:hypothetical protein [Trueperella pyogenes]
MPPSLWVRRIVTGLGLLVIIALIVWGIAKAVSAVTKSSAPEATPSASATPTPTPTATVTRSGTAALQDGEQATADGIVDAEGRVRIPACASADLTVRPTISGGEVGQAQNISVAIENRAGVACSFEFGHIDFKISTGDETVYDGSKCQRDRESATLLLIPGDTWNGGLTWDGGLYSGCDAKDRNSDGATDPAPAGTYRLQLLLNGQTVGDERVFTLTQPVQPTTEATLEPSQSSTSEATNAPQGEEGH